MVLNRLRLDGRTALVFGAGGQGMGTASTAALWEAGATIVGVDISEDALTELSGRFPERFTGIRADVTEDGAVGRVVDAALEQLGHIDVLVNVAGGTRPGDWARADLGSPKAAARCMQLNLWYVFEACQLVGAHMIERGGGTIVNFSSGDSVTSSPHHAPYGMAKAGVDSLTSTLAVEWAEFNVRVNAVSPGRVETPKIRNSIPKEFDISSAEPIMRPLQPEEMGSAVLFLASDLSSGLNGQVLRVDGGITARAPGGTLRAYQAIDVPDAFAYEEVHKA